MSAYNFGGSGPSLAKLYQVTWHETGVIKWTLILQGVPLQNLGRQNCQKFGAIFDNFRLWSRMSQECVDLSKIWIVLDQLHFIPYWPKKLGELWSTNQKVIDAHVDPPKWTFFGILNLGRQGVLDPEIFTHGRHSSLLTNAHHKQGRGCPKKF